MIRYIELKSGYSDNGPAWIGRVRMSRSGRTVYFNGKAFHRTVRGGSLGNHYDIETGDLYWISGVKANGRDRHWAGTGKITIEAAAVDEYRKATGRKALDPQRFVVSNSIQPTDPSSFVELENRNRSLG